MAINFNSFAVFTVKNRANILLHFTIAGKLMGVTDFVNPKDLTKPVHEVQSFSYYNKSSMIQINLL